MAGRPPLRIGQHGKITRKQVDTGVWIARCRYRDADGVTRIVERRSPTPNDQRGKAAEDELIEALKDRRPTTKTGDLSADTLVTTLVTAHIDRMEEDGRASRTIDTYRFNASKLQKFIAGVRVSEATAARLDAAIRSMKTAHGSVMARHSRTILRGGLQLAVMANVLASNPVRDVSPITAKKRPQGAKAVDSAQLPDLLDKLRSSKYCQDHDLVDPITLLIATGLRRSELLGLRWTDWDRKAATIDVTGKVVRIKGKGLHRVAETKTETSRRTLKLPKFATDALVARKAKDYVGEQQVIFPSTAATLRDPDNFNAEWRKARDELGVPDVTSHSFRKTVATLIDDGGLSARIGADHLGHSRVSMTQDRYMARGRVHSEVADLLDKVVCISGG